ncbi:MAG: cytochrome P450 [Pseudomonadota bacterium]
MDKRVEVPVGVKAAEAPLGVWGSYRAARRNVLELIPASAFHEKIVTGGPHTKMVMLMDPDGIERVLKGAADDYPRSQSGLRMMKPRRGDNIVSASGPLWRAHRKAMSPMFQPRALAAYTKTMTHAAQVASNQVAEAGTSAFDIFPMVMGATRDVICDLALSGDETLDRDKLTDAIDGALATVTRYSLMDLLRVPIWVPRPGSILNRSRAQLDKMADQIADARRRRGPCDPPDMLDALLMSEARGDDGGITRLDLRNDIIALLFAGHETTALAIGWSIYLLALHQDVQEEVASVCAGVLGDRAAVGEDVAALPIMRQVVDEAMRLYPPAAVLGRMAAVDDELAGIPVAAGTTILIAAYALHRHRALWDEPDRFDPTRFRPDAKDKRHRYQFIPFGAGPRICVGTEFAYTEAVIILATLFARYRFTLAPGFKPFPRMWFTLRPATGVQVIAQRR